MMRGRMDENQHDHQGQPDHSRGQHEQAEPRARQPAGDEPMRVVQQPEPERELYAWQAPARLFKKRNREFYSTVAAIIFLVSVILLFAKEFLLIAVILALGFVSYMLSSVEPEEVDHRLTNKGVRTSGKLYRWQQLGRFWWEDKWNQQVMHVELPFQFPGELILLLGKGDKEAIEEIASQYLINEKPESTWVERAAQWLQEKVPLES